MSNVTRRWTMRIAATILALGLGLGTAPTKAALAERDWKTPGDKLLTFDSATNLEWLDVTYTLNRNVNYVTGELVSGGLYEGFRYASWSELLTMFSSAGITNAVNYPNLSPAHTLMGMIGGINYEPTHLFRSSAGFLSDVVPGYPNSRYYGSLVINSGYSAGPSVSIDEMFEVGLIDPGSGSWLVRSAAPIPEPQQYALMLAASALIAAVVRRRRAA